MAHRMKRRDSERGAVIVTVTLLLLVLLGFMGIALDLGHLFVIRTELQTSMDACALAAAQELDGELDSITRATHAGIAAGNANNVDLQSTSWNGKPKIVATEISFFDKDHATTLSATTARYAKCAHTQGATSTPLLRMASFVPVAASTPAAMDVGAFAEATMAPAQSTCPLPVGLIQRNSTKPDHGFVVGEWLTLLSKDPSKVALGPGQIGWLNLNPNGNNGAKTLVDQLKGICGITTSTAVQIQGVKDTLDDVWNARFGMYKNNDGPDVSPPDFTGYVYTKPVAGTGKGNNSGTTGTWQTGSNAYSDFVARRQAFAMCAATVSDCQKATGMTFNAKTLASPAQLQQYGSNRRLVAVPIIASASSGTISDFACMLMLQPIPSPFADVQLEYRGNASTPGSPCTASGLPGGTAGPLVPVLVR